MNKLILSLSLAAMSVTALPSIALAQGYGNSEARQDRRDDRRDARDERKDDRRDAKDDRRDYRRDVKDDRRDDRRYDRREDREATRDWRTYRNYDYNRPEQRGSRYYADRYYRDGRYYQPVRLNRNARIYRGNDGRYYCRRNDGTTGLVIGAAVGGLLGNRIDNGGSSLLGTLIGAGGGALLGREIDRGGVNCR